jgi:hypothetical protein
MSSKYCIIYYCYGDASPKSITHNPIPSICTLRQFNPFIPVIIMYAEDNKEYFEHYAKTLDFKLHKFTTRSNSLIHQMVYRPADTLQCLTATNFEYAVYCDADIMWHKNCNDFFIHGFQSGKSLWYCNNFNGGLYAISKNINLKFVELWHAIGHLLHTYSDTHVVRDILLDVKHSHVHDESAMAVLRALLHKSDIWDIFYYPAADCYIPIKNGPLMVSSAIAVHYMGTQFNNFLKDRFSVKTFNMVGEIGAFLSIKEYRNAMQQALGDYYRVFTQDFACLPELYSVADFINQWREYVQLH